MSLETDPRARALDAFEVRFVRRPECVVRAPGRVNLIGEHTDYTGGLVLPFAIDRALTLVAAPRDDARVRVVACDLGVAGEFGEFELRVEDAVPGFVNYIAAVARARAETGAPCRGMDIAIASDIPLGSGLSSSAALCVASALAFDRLAGGEAPREEIARWAHRAENHFVATGCGILDPYAIALCEEANALRIDCASRAWRSVRLPASEVVFLVSHSGHERELAGAAAGRGYRQRVDECVRALAALPVESFRDLDPTATADLEPLLDPVLYRRLRHVVSENARVDAMCAQLDVAGGPDLAAVGALLRASHASLRDDYQVSTPQLDALCETADALDGVRGSRMVGAGFGGCALHVVDAEAREAVERDMRAAFAERTGTDLRLFGVFAHRGAEVETLV